jgi:hypothetical protein
MLAQEERHKTMTMSLHDPKRKYRMYRTPVLITPPLLSSISYIMHPLPPLLVLSCDSSQKIHSTYHPPPQAGISIPSPELWLDNTT